jgi:glycosyltransferase involved in cell wall biosynthesis
LGATHANGIVGNWPVETQIGLFLMINTFQTGGTERQFTVLAENLSRSRFRLHLGCLSHSGVSDHDFQHVPEFPLGGSLYGWRSLHARLLLRRDLRQNQVEIAHAFGFYANLTLIPAARLAGVPVVLGSHRQLGDLMTSAQFWAQALAFRWCDAVVCNSQAAADRLAAAGLGRDRLAVIGNGLQVATFKGALPALPARPKPLRVGMVARMNASHKNHAGFLRVASEIHKAMPDVEFVLVGDGSLRPEIERQAVALGLRECTTFLGDRRDIPALLASIDVAVLTSVSESLSNSVLEAMAAGLPVVAYNVGGNKELINDHRGALVAAGNENEFARAVRHLLSSASLRAERGANAQQFVEEHFSLDRVLRQYEDLYVRLLAQHRGTEPRV